MKIYHEVNKDSPDIPDKDKEKMAILKLVDIGKYVKNVGIRDGQFYVLADDATDEVYLEYREALGKINTAMMRRLDSRVIAQKGMEYHHKKARALQLYMEIPK